MDDYQTKKKSPKDWSNLQEDFINSFAGQIDSMKDFFAFGGVCKSWRSAAIKEYSNRGLRLQHKVLVLFLPKKLNAPIHNFYSLTKGQIYQPDLPEIMDRYFCSSLGWLFTISQDLSKLHLLNPLIHAVIELPHILCLKNKRKFVLSSSPSWSASNFGVLGVFFHYLGFYKPGYNNGDWTFIVVSTSIMLLDAIYYKGEFYAVDIRGKVFVCDLEDPSNAQVRLVAPEFPYTNFLRQSKFGLNSKP